MHIAAHSLTVALLVVPLACGGTKVESPTTAPTPEQHPLSGLAATGAIIAPTFSLRVASDVSWASQIASSREVLRGLDEDITAAIGERGLRTGWIMPSDLAASYKHNPTYAADPYALAEDALRSPSFVAGSRLTEPLASQLRTMIALHENARAVLLPIEARFDRADASSTAARATLRLALVDPRFSEAKWVGTVRSDTASADPRVLTRALARSLADLIVSR